MKNLATPLNTTKIALGLMAFCGLLVFTSCEDVLEETPNAIVEENFFTNAADVETAVNATYDPFFTFNYTAAFVASCLNNTDWGYGKGSRAQMNDWTAYNGRNQRRVAGQWNSFYQAIRNANLVILNAPTGLADGQTEINQFVAEAHHMRAFYYFHLVRCWAALPLRTTDNMGERDIARSPVSDVYDLIVADLLKAEAGLPTVQSKIGRPTKYVAKTMLADVYLHLEMYSETRRLAKEVIDANVHSLIPWEVREDWYKILGPDVVTTPEEIWYIKYNRQPGQGNAMGWWTNHASTGFFPFGGSFSHFAMADDPYYRNWPAKDLRKQLWDHEDLGWGDSTIFTRKFIDPDAIELGDAACDFPLYRYSMPLYMFAEADARVAGAPTAEAMEAVNQVRRRAYGEDIFTASPMDFDIADYNLDSFIDLVLDERSYEYPYENKRWFTLKRTNKLAEIMLRDRGIVVPEVRYLWPIPPSEMNFNDLINDADQNPGY